jgi:hypothetical protein
MVGISEHKSERLESIPIRLRWLALTAGCSCGLAGSLLFGPLFFIFPFIQMLGAVLGAYSPRLGQVLLWIGACILTFYAAGFLAPQALGAISVLQIRNDLTHIALFLLLVASLALLVWSDIALVVFAVSPKRVPHLLGSSKDGSLD